MAIKKAGVLILGKSGVGKSESCLELLSRGHKLVADDITHIEIKNKTLWGKPAELLNTHMEVRGIGIVDAKAIFGRSATCSNCQINLAVELIEWHPHTEFNRLGIQGETYEILGVKIPLIRIPVSPARNPATLIEVATRNEILKQKGLNSESRFRKQVLASTRKRTTHQKGAA